jgi:hypothetical protein
LAWRADSAISRPHGDIRGAPERFRPYLLSGDASSLQFFIAKALKDINYYREMA